MSQLSPGVKPRDAPWAPSPSTGQRVRITGQKPYRFLSHSPLLSGSEDGVASLVSVLEPVTEQLLRHACKSHAELRGESVLVLVRHEDVTSDVRTEVGKQPQETLTTNAETDTAATDTQCGTTCATCYVCHCTPARCEFVSMPVCKYVCN